MHQDTVSLVMSRNAPAPSCVSTRGQLVSRVRRWDKLRWQYGLFLACAVSVSCRDRDKKISVIAAPSDTVVEPTVSTRKIDKARIDTAFVAASLPLRHTERLRSAGRWLVMQGDGVRLVAIGEDGRSGWSRDLKRDGIERVGDFQSLGDSGMVVLDDNAGRMVIIANDGALVRAIDTRGAGHIDAIAALADGRFWAVSSDVANPLIELGRTGTVASRRPFPGAWFMKLNPMARQGLVVSDLATGRWVFAPVFGNRLTVQTTGGEAISNTVRVGGAPFPDVIRTQRGATTEERLGRAVLQVIALAIWHGDVLVLTRTTDGSGRMIDRYSIADLRYKDSFAVPITTSDLAVRGERIYMLAGTVMTQLHITP